MANMTENSKSQQIRELLDQGRTVSEIAKELGIRYNFAYNVASRYCIQANKEMPRQRKESKAARIRELYQEGKSIGEIQKTLGVDYSTVYHVVGKLKGKEVK